MHHFELLGFSWSFVKPVGVHESSTSDCFWAFLETTQLVSVGSTSVGLRNFGMLRDSCFWALGTPYVFRGLQSSDVFMLPPGDRESDKALAELLSVTHLQTSHPQFDGCSVCLCVCVCVILLYMRQTLQSRSVCLPCMCRGLECITEVSSQRRHFCVCSADVPASGASGENYSS